MSNSNLTNSVSVCRAQRVSIGALFTRDASVQSDDSNPCSSLESMLDLRKPDPEAVLLGLGFGPPHANKSSRIPQRFLQPSKILTNIDVNKFMEQQGEQQREQQQYYTNQKYNSAPNSPALPRPGTS